MAFAMAGAGAGVSDKVMAGAHEYLWRNDFAEVFWFFRRLSFIRVSTAEAVRRCMG